MFQLLVCSRGLEGNLAIILHSIRVGRGQGDERPWERGYEGGRNTPSSFMLMTPEKGAGLLSHLAGIETI